MTQNEQFIAVARGWIGTRFRHQGRVKKSAAGQGGCDCIGLVIGVADEAGLTHNGRKFSEYDIKDYAKTPDGDKLKAAFCEYLREIPVSQMQAGDVAMFRFNKNPQHVGIISNLNNNFGIIHCYMQARGVVEHLLDQHWRERIVAVFRFKNEL